MEDCPRCSKEIEAIKNDQEQQGSCSQCIYNGNKYDQYPCEECTITCSASNKFPKFKRLKISLPK